MRINNSIWCHFAYEPFEPTVVLQVVANMSELLRQFDVDCAAVAFEPATRKAYMTPRAKRAFEHGCNVLDSRFNSPTYAERLWKYASRGFAVAVLWLCRGCAVAVLSLCCGCPVAVL